MADKTINELVEATQVLQQDLFVLQQENTAKKLSGQTLVNYLLKMIDGHGGVTSLRKTTTSGLVDTYRFTFADESTFDMNVTNGRAITSVTQTSVNGLTRTYTIAFNDGSGKVFTVTDGRAITSVKQTSISGLTRTYTINFNSGDPQNFTVTDGRAITNIAKTGTNVLTDTYTISYNDETSDTFTVKNGRGIKSFAKVSTSGLVDTYRIEYNDDTSDQFTVKNGAKGDKGDNTYTHIKFASQEPNEDSHSFGDIPDKWIGFYWGDSAEAPTDWTQYKWHQFQGEKGDTGDAATLVSSSVEYQVSDSGTIIPSGSWSTAVPLVEQGRYLWTKVTQRFNSGKPVISYSVTRMGLDGSGSVSSVAGVPPAENGNVPLAASHVHALPDTGGDLTGELRMNGQPISGLNPPTKNDQAANMGFVNEQVKKAAPRNLLDNSDFTNPVNQRRATSATAYRYFIDRWYIGSIGNGITLTPDGIKVDAVGQPSNPYLRQYIETLPDGDYTIAAYMANGFTGYANFSVNNGAVSNVIRRNPPGLYFNPSFEDGRFRATFTLLGSHTEAVTISALALYKGTYTGETLPEYQPKGYAAELAECKRYYRRLKGDPIATGWIGGTPPTTIYMVYPEYQEMRAFPESVNALGELTISANGAYYPCTLVSHLFNDYGSRLIVKYTGETPPEKGDCMISAVDGLEISTDFM